MDESRSSHLAFLLPIVFAFGCPGGPGGGDDEIGECIGETEGPEILDGSWKGVEDWTDPGAMGNEAIMDACGWPVQSAHLFGVN